MDKEFKKWIFDLLIEGNAAKISSPQVKERFDREDTAVYGMQIPRWFPDYQYVNNLIFEVLRPTISTGALILDLGGGTGRIAKLLLDEFPACRILIQDISANMLKEVPITLSGHKSRFQCVEGDFFEEKFDLEYNRFDCILSVFAIHHGRDTSAYIRLYNKIYRWLKPGGCFVCLDNVAGDTPELAALNYASWAEALQSEYDLESIRRIVETTIREDSPLSLSKHLEIMSRTGFICNNVLWKKHIFGLYSGSKMEKED